MPQVRVEKSQAGEAEVENDQVHLVRRLHFELLLNALPEFCPEYESRKGH